MNLFALPELWRPRQAPLSPRPCYGPEVLKKKNTF
jgi:hypothetical protein